MSTRNNLLQMIAGSSWGANAQTLRTAGLSLVYAPAEYCCSSWLTSVHTSKIDVQLNRCMRTITGVIKASPLQWLPTLSNIEPPHLRRQQALVQTIKRSEAYGNSLLANFLPHVAQRSLVRNSPYLIAQDLRTRGFNVQNEWKANWNNDPPSNSFLIQDPTSRVNGFNLDRKDWVSLNRFRTGYGRSGEILHKWGMRSTSACNCGDPIQSMSHIIQCPKRSLPCDFLDLHNCSSTAITWLRDLDIDI